MTDATRARLESRDSWLELAASYARSGDRTSFRRCALRACRAHARALRHKVRRS